MKTQEQKNKEFSELMRELPNFAMEHNKKKYEEKSKMKNFKFSGLIFDFVLLSIGGLVGMILSVPFWKGFLISAFIVGLYSLTNAITLLLKEKLEK